MGVFNISVDGIDGILPGERAPRSIFNAGDIKKQLPGESAKFQEIVSWWIGSGGNGAVCCGGHDRFSSKCSMFYFCETGFLYLKLRHPDFMGKCFAFHFPSVGQGCTAKDVQWRQIMKDWDRVVKSSRSSDFRYHWRGFRDTTCSACNCGFSALWRIHLCVA